MFELHSENIILANAKPAANQIEANDQRQVSGEKGTDQDKKSTFQKVKKAPNRKKSEDFLATKINLNDNKGDWLQDIRPENGQLEETVLRDESQSREQKGLVINRRATGRFGLKKEDEKSLVS